MTEPFLPRALELGPRGSSENCDCFFKPLIMRWQALIFQPLFSHGSLCSLVHRIWTWHIHHLSFWRSSEDTLVIKWVSAPSHPDLPFWQPMLQAFLPPLPLLNFTSPYSFSSLLIVNLGNMWEANPCYKLSAWYLSWWCLPALLSNFSIPRPRCRSALEQVYNKYSRKRKQGWNTLGDVK